MTVLCPRFEFLIWPVCAIVLHYDLRANLGYTRKPIGSQMRTTPPRTSACFLSLSPRHTHVCTGSVYVQCAPMRRIDPPSGPGPSQSQPRSVIIDGVVFEASKCSLVCKDSAFISSSGRLLAQLSFPVKPSSKLPSFGPRPCVQSQFSRNKSQVGPRA